MKFTLTTLLIFALFTISCKEPVKKKDLPTLSSTSIIGSWRLSDVHQNDKEDINDNDKLLKSAQDREILQQGIIISFFEDGTFTEMRGSGEYKNGQWKSADSAKRIYLIDSNPTDSLLLSQEGSGKWTLHQISDSTNIDKEFIQYALPLSDYHEDPFYFTNNLWRIKPLKAETNKQVEERLANYFKHLAYLLKSSKERKSKVVSFEFSQGIVKIYDGGIGIQPVHLIPKTWTDTYYNKDNAMTAFNMFTRYLENSSYKGASTGAWIDDDYNILSSIYGDIMQGKFQIE